MFADVIALSAGCRFHNCRLMSEPGCAVRAALDDGTLDPERYARFTKLAAEDVRNSEALHERRARERVNSGHWNGTAQDLDAVTSQHALAHPIVPIRDAIDFVHACIHSTIRAMKFSRHSQICGGPIELAVVTADRNFRWVRHKPWDAAITEGDHHD